MHAVREVSRLILASTSPYRRELLQRLRVPFDVAKPDVDEAARPGEAPAVLAPRLARTKALAVAARAGDAWVLGSDQVADFEGRALGKPGTREAAIAQLGAMAGHAVCFHTAVYLARADGRHFAARDLTTVHFRDCSDLEIERYVDAEQPFDCAGSFKSEGLGIVLFDRIESQDPTALVGLPLIATCTLLRKAGFVLP